MKSIKPIVRNECISKLEEFEGKVNVLLLDGGIAATEERWS